MSVYDISGRIVRIDRLAPSRPTFAIADLLPGTYILRIESGPSMQTFRFVKD
ncbi:MAG: T9SS type A sorting domain-containing protein [Flavobacteriales bacterium]|nr:T9SS type A sorting domain-containing protein [Flavobacteriales bacterium]